MNSRAVPSLDVPRQGYVLSTTAEKYGGPLRRAVEALRGGIPSSAAAIKWKRLYSCRRVEPGSTSNRSEAELGAWVVVAAWVVGIASRSISVDATLVEAETWFLGSPSELGIAALATPEARSEAEDLLRSVVDVKVFSELLPYILDPHGQGSRLSVVRRPETATARKQKRADGVFYTPGDVARFMVGEVLHPLQGEGGLLSIFDPACGSGVFLRAALRELMHIKQGSDPLEIACSCLYGTDIDPWALGASAFVLLLDCFASVEKRGIPPITAWHALRLNLAQVDALRLDPSMAERQTDHCLNDLQACRRSLLSGVLVAETGNTLRPGPIPIQEVFPALSSGPRVLIGNPPYAEINGGSDLLSLVQRFETFRAAPRPSSDLFPLFVEQMIRLVAENAHGGAMVLPLSIACNSGSQFVAIRNLIEQTPGEWRFAFFDREPHALFGEDVKTRNTIVIWDRNGRNPDVGILTGPLRKWRGHSRARMLSKITFTPINVGICAGIPKIHGPAQASALEHLSAIPIKLENIVKRIGRTTLTEAMQGEKMEVYVGATAYNFLNVFLRPTSTKLEKGASLTQNPLHAIICPDPGSAIRAYALLNSRLAFWWWHIHGDGFHVSRRCIESLPVGNVMEEASLSNNLTDLGMALWSQVSKNPIVSLNRGSMSLGFSAGACKEREAIDLLLVGALGLPASFMGELEQFCDDVVSASMKP